MWRKTRAETSSQTYERGLLGLLSPPDLPAEFHLLTEAGKQAEEPFSQPTEPQEIINHC